MGRVLALLVALSAALRAQGPANVLVVVNDRVPVSKSIGEYYARKRGVPLENVCHIAAPGEQDIPRQSYLRDVAAPIATCLRSRNLVEQVLYIVTTLGVPLRVIGTGDMGGDQAAVDSELTLLYSEIHGAPVHANAGNIPNPFYSQKSSPFAHPKFPIYLVTRLAAYDFEDVRKMIDRAQHPMNRGKVVVDLRNSGDPLGDEWLKNTAIFLPKDRVVLDETAKVVTNQSDVIGYASWGSNDKNRKTRTVKMQWLPGAIMTEFVSTNARTFTRPPANWNISDWGTPQLHFFGSPQTMVADYIEEGVTGTSGHVNEPYLGLNPRPDILFPAYLKGRNLAESYYLSIPGLSWQNVVLGDPLCKLE